jgi:hypothetical protein
MRAILIACLLVAAACSREEAPPASSAGVEAPTGSAPAADAAPAGAPAWVRDRWATLPAWERVARLPDGGAVSYSPKSIVRDASGVTSVQVQIEYGEPREHISEDEATRQTITYARERLLYRFRCADRTIAIVERQILEGDKPAETIPVAEEYRPLAGGGPAALLEGPVCKAA